ncbi:hypothetical protein F4810DRAFT_646438 [Camillea tinctor]|nr:hypothetical protein F4810DRAFT_646438 [Camillea tinctor]
MNLVLFILRCLVGVIDVVGITTVGFLAEFYIGYMVVADVTATTLGMKWVPSPYVTCHNSTSTEAQQQCFKFPQLARCG